MKLKTFPPPQNIKSSLLFENLKAKTQFNAEFGRYYCHNPGQPKTKSPGVVLLSGDFFVGSAHPPTSF